MDSGTKIIPALWHQSITDYSVGRIKCVLLILILLPLISSAQTLSTDSIGKSFDKVQKLNASNKLDSLQETRINNIDSLQNQKRAKADSISNALNKKLVVSTNQFNSRIDSLSKLNLAPDVHAQKLDSLHKSFQSGTINKLKAQYDSAGIKADQKLSKVESIIDKRSKALDSLLVSKKGKPLSLDDKVNLEKLNTKIPDLPNTPGLDVSTPGINTDLNLPNLNGPNTGVNIPDATMDISKATIPDVEGAEKIDKAKDIGGDVNQYAKGAEEIKEEIKKVKEGEYSEELKEKAGEQVQNQTQDIDQVKELTKHSKSVEELNAKAKSMSEMADMKNELKINKKPLKDHFAGKDELVKKDMDKIGKAQLKYRNIADSRNLPKRVPNEMKGKPFVERLIPAISFQIYNGENVSVDFVPTIGYRITGKIRAGAGAYRRVTYLQNEKDIRIEDIFGIRLYNNVKLIKEFHSHIELETFKSNLKPVNPVIVNNNHGWNHKLNVGFYQTYKITKNLNGHAIIMYDVLKIKEFPGSKNSGVRFGFDYQIKKKKKK